MSRSGESVTRLDIRFPNEMYEKLQQLAVKDGARTHHISQKVELSPTVIKLVQFALDALAGMVSDSSDEIPDSLSDMLVNSLSDKIATVPDISDKKIKSIVDKRLTELGLFPVSSNSLPDTLTDNLPDTNLVLSDSVILLPDNLPDNLPDSDVIISDKVTLLPDNLSDTDVGLSDNVIILPDNLSDTKNIPSDDSDDSESIAEVVQVIPTDAIDQVIGDISDSLSWGDFHKLINLPASTPNKANGNIAITTAKANGYGDWIYSSTTRKFTKSPT